MRIHWLQHVPFEGLGAIEVWARAGGHALRGTRLYAGEPLPGPQDFDALVVMGGPMGVADAADFPWLLQERRFLQRVLDTEVPVLGVCLGAQLLAAAGGARVRRAPEPEIGWLPVERVGDHPLALALPERFEALHWHGDTFDPPPAAQRLLRSEACENQAFCLDGRVLALQFHLEVTRAGAEALLRHCAGDLVPGPYVQTPRAILAEEERFQRAHGLLGRLLGTWLSGTRCPA